MPTCVALYWPAARQRSPVASRHHPGLAYLAAEASQASPETRCRAAAATLVAAVAAPRGGCLAAPPMC